MTRVLMYIIILFILRWVYTFLNLAICLFCDVEAVISDWDDDVQDEDEAAVVWSLGLTLRRFNIELERK